MYENNKLLKILSKIITGYFLRNVSLIKFSELSLWRTSGKAESEQDLTNLQKHASLLPFVEFDKLALNSATLVQKQIVQLWCTSHVIKHSKDVARRRKEKHLENTDNVKLEKRFEQ